MYQISTNNFLFIGGHIVNLNKVSAIATEYDAIDDCTQAVIILNNGKKLYIEGMTAKTVWELLMESKK